MDVLQGTAPGVLSGNANGSHPRAGTHLRQAHGFWQRPQRLGIFRLVRRRYKDERSEHLEVLESSGIGISQVAFLLA